MKKRFAIIVLAIFCLLMLNGCSCEHEWLDASCQAPLTCAKCGEKAGNPLEHTWQEANCKTPKTCKVCGEIEGEALGHDWLDATLDRPKMCVRCSAFEGERIKPDAYMQIFLDAGLPIPKSDFEDQDTETDSFVALIDSGVIDHMEYAHKLGFITAYVETMYINVADIDHATRKYIDENIQESLLVLQADGIITLEVEYGDEYYIYKINISDLDQDKIHKLDEYGILTGEENEEGTILLPIEVTEKSLLSQGYEKYSY